MVITDRGASRAAHGTERDISWTLLLEFPSVKADLPLGAIGGWTPPSTLRSPVVDNVGKNYLFISVSHQGRW